MSNLEIQINKKIYKLEKSFIFSAGEIQIKLPDNMETPTGKHRENIYIKTKLDSSNAIMELILTCDALDRKFPNEKFVLIANYFPYARQDRVCVEGEAFSLEVMCNLINGLGFDHIFILDAHSNVLSDMLLNVVEKEQDDIFIECVNTFDIDLYDSVFISPDKGALYKTDRIATYYGKESFNAYKVRDPETGEIVETKIEQDDFYGRNIMIVDDIADNGMTFYFLAKLLKTKNCGKISLFVSHAIFPNGPDKLFEYIDEIYTTDSIFDSNTDIRINVLKL